MRRAAGSKSGYRSLMSVKGTRNLLYYALLELRKNQNQFQAVVSYFRLIPLLNAIALMTTCLKVEAL